MNGSSKGVSCSILFSYEEMGNFRLKLAKHIIERLFLDLFLLQSQERGEAIGPENEGINMLC